MGKFKSCSIVQRPRSRKNIGKSKILNALRILMVLAQQDNRIPYLIQNVFGIIKAIILNQRMILQLGYMN